MEGLDVSPYLSSPVLAVVLLCLGLGLGILTGLFGVGGGFLVVPLLTIPLGINYSLAKGSSLACILGASISGLMRHLRLGNVAVKTMFIVAGGAMCGAALGGMFNDWLELTVCGRDQVKFTMIMHPMYIVLLLFAAWSVLRGSDTGAQGLTPLQKLPLGPKIRIRLANMDNVSLPGLAYLGLAIGLLTGLLGVGGGVLMMPILLSVVGLTPKQAVGTSLGIILFASAAGTVKYGLIDQVNIWIAMLILAGSTIGVQIGAWLCEILHASKIRKYFAVLTMTAVVMVVYDLVRTMMNK